MLWYLDSKDLELDRRMKQICCILVVTALVTMLLGVPVVWVVLLVRWFLGKTEGIFVIVLAFCMVDWGFLVAAVIIVFRKDKEEKTKDPDLIL